MQRGDGAEPPFANSHENCGAAAVLLSWHLSSPPALAKGLEKAPQGRGKRGVGRHNRDGRVAARVRVLGWCSLA